MAEEAIESITNSLKKFTFWGTQPVPAIEEKIEETVNEPIEADKPVSEVRQEPYNLPDGFEWNTLDIEDPDIVSFTLIYRFLFFAWGELKMTWAVSLFTFA